MESPAKKFDPISRILRPNNLFTWRANKKLQGTWSKLKSFLQ